MVVFGRHQQQTIGRPNALLSARLERRAAVLQIFVEQRKFVQVADFDDSSAGKAHGRRKSARLYDLRLKLPATPITGAGPRRVSVISSPDSRHECGCASGAAPRRAEAAADDFRGGVDPEWHSAAAKSHADHKRATMVHAKLSSIVSRGRVRARPSRRAPAQGDLSTVGMPTECHVKALPLQVQEVRRCVHQHDARTIGASRAPHGRQAFPW